MELRETTQLKRGLYETEVSRGDLGVTTKKATKQEQK